jgi:hypothetical protein
VDCLSTGRALKIKETVALQLVLLASVYYENVLLIVDCHEKLLWLVVDASKAPILQLPVCEAHNREAEKCEDCVTNGSFIKAGLEARDGCSSLHSTHSGFARFTYRSGYGINIEP